MDSAGVEPRAWVHTLDEGGAFENGKSYQLLDNWADAWSEWMFHGGTLQSLFAAREPAPVARELPKRWRERLPTNHVPTDREFIEARDAELQDWHAFYTAHGSGIAHELDVEAERPATWESRIDFRPGGYCDTKVAMVAMQDEITEWRAKATAESAPASAAPPELPAILFDGHAVYVEITRKLGRSHCISYQSVSATLDAVARLIRAPSNSPVGAKEQE